LSRPIFLFTTSFPYGHGETFLENEIPILLKEFKEVTVIPINPFGQARTFPEGVVVLDVFKDFDYQRKLNLINLKRLITVLVLGMNRGRWLNGNLKTRTSAILRTFSRADYFLDIIQSIEHYDSAIYYSYWLSEWALVLSILSSDLGKNAKFVSRAHGFDLYDNREGVVNRINKSYVLKKLHGVFPVSEQGTNYLKQAYPKYNQKIVTAYLGTRNPNEKSVIIENNRFTIASCSSLIPLKRVDLIIKTLRQIKEEILWVHHGDGPLEEALKKEAKSLPENIEVKWMGNVDNRKIHDYYSSNRIDVFVLLSSIEGLPMSIMEAHSYGIPAICTNVGGVSEIVNETNGALLSGDYIVNDLVMILSQMINGELVFNEKIIINNWSLNFSDRNYSQFCAKIKSL
jgi:glycosyltransferase involved in cell wall biosynthesis